MSKVNRKGLTPNLRFPEFLSEPGWDLPELEEISDRIQEKAGDSELETISISAGIGFVSQKEKFSRDISGQQYKNYIKLKKGEFAYNKGNSKKFPQGCIYKLKEFNEGAAPNSFICFRFKPIVVPDFYQGYFESNFHGKQLTKYITSGARMDGLLNISPDNFFKIILPTPSKKEEQQKIADCLSSLDELIQAETERLDALQAHKKGLMQQLFPAEGETVPKLRFPEFQDSGEWVERELGEITSYVDYRGKTPPKSESGAFLVTAKNIRNGYIDYEVSKEYIPLQAYENVMSRGKPKMGDVLITTEAPLGNVATIDVEEIALAQRVIKFRGKKNILENPFLKQTFLSPYFQKKLEKNSTGSTAKGIKGSVLRKLIILFPSPKEQQYISLCLSTLDQQIYEQEKKIESLKSHKKGLLQHLFPQLD
ncbi:restriction endonuclease subunit S [Algoriphagus sp. oki45]|uniref:restriction endonuclease subunit S n=1 Tax=Algoriphagus sp. oki45 TaxID=3067294 RepID=UPI0027F0ACD7|nr:restriction endonuclease subunit S [Algoriphagus sp. oki45]